jgi:hypothetical protein
VTPSPQTDVADGRCCPAGRDLPAAASRGHGDIQGRGDRCAVPWEDPEAAVLDGLDTDEVRPGGPPPDGILPMDEPCSVSVSVAAADGWLDDDSVLVVEAGGAARAYPLAMMTQHEIVNDVLGGVPLAVTYCPLCNSGLAFERTIDGEVWDFGTSGHLLRSRPRDVRPADTDAVVAVHGHGAAGRPGRRQSGAGTVAHTAARVLDLPRVVPEGTVLGRESDQNHSYGPQPLPGGTRTSRRGSLFRGDFDDRPGPDERVVGIGDGAEVVAIALSVLREQEAVAVTLGDQAVMVVWTPGQASALDTSQVGEGRDVGPTAAFVAAGLEPRGDGLFVDPSTGAVHDVTGRTVDGDAPDLEPVAPDDTFWFVWFAFQPDTSIAA